MWYDFIIFAGVRDTACSYNPLYVCYNIIGHKTVLIHSCETERSASCKYASKFILI
jgi:hypothetical protein